MTVRMNWMRRLPKPVDDKMNDNSPLPAYLHALHVRTALELAFGIYL